MERAGGRYWAFISYSHADKAVAGWLHRALESYRIPAKLVGEETALGAVPQRLAPIFRDRDELPASGSLSQELQAALAASRALVVICSPAAARSPWVNEEVRQFRLLHGPDAKLLALIAGGDPADVEQPCFPPALLAPVDGGQDTAEPIAADLRPGADGKRLARLKLVAGLTGLPLDALVERNARRAQRRMGLAAGASLLLAAVMALLAVQAVQGRREAERQRAEADGLIEFMLTDLREKLEPVGRLSVLDSVGQRALGYYTRQNLSALDADELGRRARALHLVGEVRGLRGDSEGALKAFAEAERATAEQLERDPASRDRMFDHAQSLFWVGNVALERNDWPVAESRFRRYAELADAMAKGDAGNAKWLKEQGYAANALGSLYQYRGRAAEAAAQFRRYVGFTSAVARLAPDDPNLAWEEGQAHGWLSDALRDGGQLSAAQAERAAELAIYRRILAADPDSAEAQASRWRANEALAELHLLEGDVGAAVREARLAAGGMQAQSALDPANQLWREMATGSANQLTEALLLAGDMEGAKLENGRALAQAAQLVATDPSSEARQALRMQAMAWQVAISFAEGRRDEARGQAQAFLTRFGPAMRQSPGRMQRIAWLNVVGLATADRMQAGARDEAAALAKRAELPRTSPPGAQEAALLAAVQPVAGDREQREAASPGYPAARLFALADAQ